MTTTLKFYLFVLPLFWPTLATAYLLVYLEYGYDGVKEVRQTRVMPEWAFVFGVCTNLLYFLFIFVMTVWLITQER